MDSNPVIRMIVFAALIELVLHWFPWQRLLGRELPRVAAYVLGILGVGIPFSLAVVQSWPMTMAVDILGSFWGIVIGAGAAVIAGYLVDYAIAKRAEAQDAREAEQALKAGQE